MQRIWILMMLALGVITSPAIAASPDKKITPTLDAVSYGPIRLEAGGGTAIRLLDRR